MGYFEWKSDLEIGIGTIDAHHKKLVGQIDDLWASTSQGKKIEVLRKKLDELVSFTDRHFSFEEELFDRFSYPDGAVHKAEHQMLGKKIRALQAELAEGRVGMTVPTLSFLKDWLKNHIQESDKAYGPYLVKKGVN